MAYNKTCDPLNSTFDVPTLPPIPGLDGFTLDLNFPTLGLELPEGIPEDLLDWVRRLKFNLPGGGVLEDVLQSLQDTIADIIGRLLQSLNFFLSLYNFLMAIIQVIICIIDVLTAFMSIRKMIKRIKCLIRKCLPLFVRVVLPFFALLVLLLNLLALLLALIEYIIELLRRLIDQLLISSLMCLFEHIFVLLSIIDLVIDLMKGRLKKDFKVCSGDDGSSTKIFGNDDLCASFLQQPDSSTNENPESWKVRMKGNDSGTIFYCNQVYGVPFPFFPATALANIRNESVYLEDNSLANALKFNQVISYKPLNENRHFLMFPFDKVITAETEFDMIPYFVDISMDIDPNDGYGARNITVKNSVVVLPTLKAPLTVVDSVSDFTTNDDGYLLISGGETEDSANLYDGYTIEKLFSDSSGLSASDNGDGTNVSYSNITYQVTANYEALVEYGLITIGCLPSMKVEYDHFEETYEKPISNNLVVDLPDVSGAITSMREAISLLSSGINTESINDFGDSMNEILVDLSDQANTAYFQLLDQSIDLYNININAVPDLQFISDPIELTVTPLSDDERTFDELVGGFGSSVDINQNISNKFTATATLGEISDFVYDGYGNFIAEITSNIPGDGYVEVFYNGDQIPTVITPTSVDDQPSIVYNPTEYTFVGYFSDGYGNLKAEGTTRRDEGDVSRN